MINEFGDCAALPPRKPTLYHIDDANDDEPGFIAARPIRQRPIMYRGFEIYFDPPPIPTRACDWHYVHKDYDGPEDNRCGSGASFKECVNLINDHFEDDGPEPVYTIGDGMGGTTKVWGDEKLFVVAEALGDGYCDEFDSVWEETQRGYGIPQSFIDRPIDFTGKIVRAPSRWRRFWEWLTGWRF